MLLNALPPTVIRQHWYVLILPLLGSAAMLLIALAYAAAASAPLIGVSATLAAALYAVMRVRAWLLFSITFSPQWVVIQESYFGIPKTTAYPYTSIRSTTCFRGLSGWLYNSGTLTLTFAAYSRHFVGLTPYSALTAALV